jgi:hypothetical protein
MEATFAEEYSAIHKGLLHYLGLYSEPTLLWRELSSHLSQ